MSNLNVVNTLGIWEQRWIQPGVIILMKEGRGGITEIYGTFLNLGEGGRSRSPSITVNYFKKIKFEVLN